MFTKYLIVASKKDKAGINITTQLSQFRKGPAFDTGKDTKGFDFYLVDDEILNEEVLDFEKINKYDFVIFASRHSSDSKKKTLSVHAPGNWRKAEHGGKEGKVCPSSALFQKYLFEKINENVLKHDLRDYDITMEATHHGPLINKPCVFVEVGSTEMEWGDKRASFILAVTIKDAIEEFKKNKFREIAVGIGGPHYCPAFNEIQKYSNVALSHIIPGYALPLTEEMIKEAVAKTIEEIDFVVLDWKGLGNEEERKRIVGILDRLYINWKKASDI